MLYSVLYYHIEGAARAATGLISGKEGREMYYADKAEQDKAARTAIEEYRRAAACYPVFAEVARSFDGKCYNRRFDEALQAAVDRRFGTYAPEGGDRERRRVSIYVQKESKFIRFAALGGWRHYGLTVAQMQKDDLKDGKRIRAEILIASAREWREKHLQSAAKIERDMGQIDSYRERIQQIKKTLDAMRNGISCEAREIYNLDRYFR